MMCFSLQGEDLCERTNDKGFMCLHSSMQEEDIHEDTNGMCHLCAL